MMLGVFASFLLVSIVLSTSALHSKVGNFKDASGGTTAARRVALDSPDASSGSTAPGWHPKHFAHHGGGGVEGGGGGAMSSSSSSSSSHPNNDNSNNNKKPPGVRVVNMKAREGGGAEDNTPEAAVRRSQLRALTDDELAKLKQLDPESFSAVPPSGGAKWDPNLKNPCWRELNAGGAPRPRCLPYYYVIGAWQSGGQTFNAKLAKHPQVRIGPGATHFWNEDRSMSEYLPRYDAFAQEVMGGGGGGDGGGAGDDGVAVKKRLLKDVVVGDASPGNLANSWAESQRLHREFARIVRDCWQACQSVPDQSPADAPEGSPTARRMCIDGREWS